MWFFDSVTSSLYDSVCNKQSNISAAFHQFGPKIFASTLAKNYVSKKFPLQRASWARAGGKINSDLSSYLNYFTRYRSENWNLGLKLQNKIKIFYEKFSAAGCGPKGWNWICQFWSVASFCIKMTQNYFRKVLVGIFCAGSLFLPPLRYLVQYCNYNCSYLSLFFNSSKMMASKSQISIGR